MRALELGDMLVVGEPPAKLLKALAVISDALHSGFELCPRIIPGKSKESCVLCSLTVRDFLRRIGVEARVRVVATIMRATKDGAEIHSLGIGHPDGGHEARDGYWTGHMVVEAEGFLIDTTLYRARREAWSDLPGMIALPVQREDGKIYGLDVMTGATIGGDEADGYQFEIAWLDHRSNRRWRQGGDARDQSRRQPVIRRMVERFGVWRDDTRASA